MSDVEMALVGVEYERHYLKDCVNSLFSVTSTIDWNRVSDHDKEVMTEWLEDIEHRLRYMQSEISIMSMNLRCEKIAQIVKEQEGS